MRKLLAILFITLVVNVFGQCPYTLTASATPATCSTCCNGVITSTASGFGCEPTTFSLQPIGLGSPNGTWSNLCPGNYTVMLGSGCCIVSCGPITVNGGPTQIKESEILNYQIKLYPNPVSNTLYISSEQSEFKNAQIEISNYLGQTILKQSLKNEIDVSWLSSAGIWVKPTSLGTFSYVVTQNICGNIKTDTVNVNMSSGVNENILFAQSIGVYPQPAKDAVNISLSNFYEPTIQIKIYDVNGRLVRNENLAIHNGNTQIETSEFCNGVYTLQLISKNQIAQKRLIITR